MVINEPMLYLDSYLNDSYKQPLIISHMLKATGAFGFKGMESRHPIRGGIVLGCISIGLKGIKFFSPIPYKLFFGLLFSSLAFFQILGNDYVSISFAPLSNIFKFNFLYEFMIFKNVELYHWIWHPAFQLLVTYVLYSFMNSTLSLCLIYI